MTSRLLGYLALVIACISGSALAAEFGSKGGPPPANINQIAAVLHQDSNDLELLISFGTSKGGSAGHIALAVRGDGASDDDTVYSANFYADRTVGHETRFDTSDLILAIPKREYLFETTSSLSETTVFGLDFGEIYKRSVIGVRVFGVPAQDRQSLVAFFQRVNADYHRRATDVAYHRGEVKYDYFRLNCAKAIGAAFKYGAGYQDLKVKSPRALQGRRVVAAATANIPTEMALQLMSAWNARGYRMDVVLYKKYGDSSYVEPREDPKIAFKDLPNRFPSVLSLDFRREQGAYRDFDNLFAMYLLYNLGRYSVRLDGRTRLLEIERDKEPMDYPAAAKLAKGSAKSDSDNFRRHTLFRPLGKSIGETPDNTHLYDYSEEAPRP
ncbi:hypothetical protein [Cupriavidus pauculus]|uniref:DUF4105 domain-containing protein n=1 Tax=Cupriavidus pauculus TaxID=82633 RepID=A0A2N5CDX9_9BURK|nr:hypothetical protein [Cupriavidus pauculus]PLQ00382.1 hypothetical protein CYJ10_12180 [Cupriavidus pauculus]